MDKKFDDKKINDPYSFMDSSSITLRTLVYLKTEMKSLKYIVNDFNKFFIKEKENLKNHFFF